MIIILIPSSLLRSSPLSSGSQYMSCHDASIQLPMLGCPSSASCMLLFCFVPAEITIACGALHSYQLGCCTMHLTKQINSLGTRQQYSEPPYDDASFLPIMHTIVLHMSIDTNLRRINSIDQLYMAPTPTFIPLFFFFFG